MDNGGDSLLVKSAYSIAHREHITDTDLGQARAEPQAGPDALSTFVGVSQWSLPTEGWLRVEEEGMTYYTNLSTQESRWEVDDPSTGVWEECYDHESASSYYNRIR